MQEKLELQKELLHIIESNYNEPKEWYSQIINTIEVNSEEDLLLGLKQAKEEQWNDLCIHFYDNVELIPEIGDLKDLKRLQIEVECGNTFELVFPEEFFNLTGLESLSAYDCKLKSLPSNFDKLENLVDLNLNDNIFEEFPRVICKLKKLESLAINSKFTSLPDDICELKNLRYLYLPVADINKLPERIGNLEKLEILCIWGTKVGMLPSSCKKWKNIKSLYITKSLFKDIIPPEILSQSPQEVINYMLHYQSEKQREKVYESKMIIVGQGGVGKTCLLNRLIYDKYDETDSTEGIDIATWEFEVGETTYKLNVWDFGGQEIYHATHQFFLTSRSLYVFVWDARQEEEYGRIDYWLHTIKSFANDSPIILVINKCDSRNSIKQLDLKSIRIKFPQIIDVFNVSCKDNININELRDAIMQATTSLPLMGIEWLSSWLQVRTELVEIAKEKDIITYREYLEICKKHDVQEEDAVSLSKYLHDLGIIINFQQDTYLKNIVILNPEWGTDAVYRVLDAQETFLKDRNGILYVEDLPMIWNDYESYPKETYQIILRLMENFQLSFEIENDKTFLIAELLENEEIEYVIPFVEEQSLNFQYHYDFLAAGIITKFIVKANRYLVEINGKKACWKKGVYLQYEDVFACVKLYDGITDRKVEIRVYGENQRNKREFLCIIRNYFEEIHNSIKKISYKELIQCNCSKDCEYLHDYRYLLKLEEANIDTERCKESLNDVSVSKILDGIDVEKKYYSRKKANIVNIEMNPQFQINPHIEVNNINKTEITIDIKNCLCLLQGDVEDIKDEVLEEYPELCNNFNKIKDAIEKLSYVKTKEEILSSGALNKIKRFLEEAQDLESDLGKAINKIKFGASILKKIGQRYNDIARWCGFPVIPMIKKG